MRAMARTESGDAALVEVKAVQPSWPTIGAAAFEPSMSTAQALAESDGSFGAVAEETLLARLHLKVGDAFRLGEARFVLRAVLISEPDRLAVGVGLGPRVLISQAALNATGLVQPGSLVRWTTRVVMDGPGGAPDEAAVKALIQKANAAFPEAGWETRSRLNVSPDFTRDLDRFAEFLTLAGLLSLVVGGVGVANAAQGFVERKRTTLAILKAIGATGASVVALALVEFTIVALAGALAGAAIGVAIPFAVNRLFADIIPIPLAPSVDPRLVLLGVAYGLLTALAFSIPPLGRAHDLPVTTLIRDLAEERQGWPRARYLAGAALAGGALVALAVAASPQRTIAVAVVGATLAAFVALRFVALGIAFAARHAGVSRPVEMRMALAAIHRPGALTASVVLSLGLGLTALVALTLIDFNMRSELRQTQPGVTPSFFFLDLRSSQAAAFVEFLKREAPGAKISEVPMMRGRFVEIAGTPAAKVKASDKVAWALEGDRGVTFSDEAAGRIRSRGRRLVAGRLCRSAARLDGKGGRRRARLEDRRRGRRQRARARRYGDGRQSAEGQLAQLRDQFRARLFAEHLQGRAVQRTRLHRAAARATDPDQEIALLRAAARDFPTVTSVRVRDALEAVEGLVAKLALAIRAATGVALATSVLVLAGALAANRRARLADATILKILGATRTRLTAMFLMEYAILGGATAAFGVGAGALTAWLVVKRIMFSDFAFDWTSALAAAGGGLAFTVGLGMIGAWRILGQKPAAFLREL